MIERLEYDVGVPKIILRLNEVIDELNELAVCKADKKPAPWPQESAKRTITTPPGRELHMKNNGSKDLVLVVEQGDFLLPSALISADKEDVTLEPSQQVQNVTQGKPGCNPAAKKEEQSPLIQELIRNQAYAIEEAKLQAVEAYKKRLVDRLKDASFDDEHGYLIYLATAIEVVEETE